MFLRSTQKLVRLPRVRRFVLRCHLSILKCWRLIRGRSRLKVMMGQKAESGGTLPGEWLEVYLLCPKLDQDFHHRKFLKSFIRMLSNVDNYVVNQPVFFNEQYALRYCRYLGGTHGVIRAFVLQVAVESRRQILTLRKGFLKAEQVHGCFPSWGSGQFYFQNPDFNILLIEKISRKAAVEDEFTEVVEESAEA